MYTTQRSPLLGAIIKHRLAIVLSIIIVVLSVWTHEEIKRYQEISQALGLTINEQSTTIQEMESENSELKAHISKLKEEKKQLEDKVDKLSTKETVVTQTTKKDFKSYMSYKAITNRSSQQYKLQQQAYTDTDGIRCIDSKPMVAIGTGWGLKVGDSALVTCENGNSFKVVVGDIKANIHTKSDNKTTISNGCRCEFIVDMSKLNATVKNRGNVAVLEKYSGYITNIVKI